MTRPMMGAAIRAWACFVILLGLLAAPITSAEPERPYEVSEEREPCADYDPLRQPFYGDTHVHTSYSFDASTQDTRNTPADAYRFAKGERVGIQPYDEKGVAQRSIQLGRPLDFTAVTDHAEMLGEVHICTNPNAEGYDSIICWIHRNWPGLAFYLISARGTVLKSRWYFCGDDAENCLAASGGVWRSIQQAAEESYDRSASCRFTSFNAYEWTATVGEGRNLHRNVIFKNAHVPDLPISWIETRHAEELWSMLDSECLKGTPGCDVLTIPHNSNLSGGLIFETPALAATEDEGAPITAEQARLRQRWEPIVEIMQHKGDSECVSTVGASDEACGFEHLPYDRFGAKFSRFATHQKATSANFVRSALKQGLKQQQEIGVNSLKFGIVAATDTHIAAPGLTDEKDHPGHGGAGMGAGDIQAAGFNDDLEFGPGGLSVVWAEENTRDSLFAAMMRREVYGTSGSRPTVRFFGGWSYPDDLCAQPDLVAQGYGAGVAMGGDLVPGPMTRAGKAPRFAFSVLKDVGDPGRPGTPLQRLQIIKGWYADDAMHELVYDVAGGKNDASVDLLTCEPTGDGASSLCSVWEDPDFDSRAPAFYYGRVLENPTCRWSQYTCNAAGVRCDDPSTVPEGLAGCCAPEHQPIIQERAWTSPIWYTP